jgi:ABC-type multidrug transport system permease subunit
VPLTQLYAGILALLVGSLTSAPERQLGTLQWQMLLPVAAWRQWLTKTGVACALALIFGIAVPMALASVAQTSERLAPQQVRWLTLGVLTLTAIGTYLSSLCRRA